MTDDKISRTDILAQMVDIVSAYVSKNAITSSDLPTLMERVHAQLIQLANNSAPSASRPHPAVPIKKSVTNDYLICLEDGKKLKMLKRYLRTRFDMSPDEYRARWGLPSDYPMVAPEYAERRSLYAKKIGLGKTRS